MPTFRSSFKASWLAIILDQFEEFFIRLSPQSRAAFIAELGALYDAHDVPVKVVLSLREDWLAAVNEVRQRIPEVFYVDMRLLPLTRELAQEAITGPVGRLGVSYEPALVTRLLDDLAGGEEAVVMPPQLQLVCSALYDGLQPDGRQISLVAYERLGGARGVLQQYLDDELARLGSGERALARSALEDLVTSQGTKAVKTLDELALALRADGSDLELVLEKLVRARLLRRLEREEGRLAYELAHEYLIHEIGLRAEAQSRKEAEELVQQEVETWRRFGTLLSADELALLDGMRDMLRLNDAAQELLLRSALHVGYQVDYWQNRIDDPQRRMAILTECARSERTKVRKQAVESLRREDNAQARAILLESAVHDHDSIVRTAARHGLAKNAAHHPEAAEWLRAEAERTIGETRRAALETLAVLSLRSLPAKLRVRVFLQTLIIRLTPLLPTFVQWVLASTVGAAIGWTLSNAVFGLLFGLGFGDAFGGVSGSQLGVMYGAVFGAASGMVLGGAQWLVLREQVQHASWWVVLSMIGWVMGGAAGSMLGRIISSLASGSVFWIVFGATSGLFIGVAQWLFLRRLLHRPGWWLLVNSVAWAIGWAMVERFLFIAVGAMSALLAPLDPTARDVMRWWPPGDTVRWFVGGAILGIVGGAITGGALAWLLKRPLREAEPDVIEVTQ